MTEQARNQQTTVNITEKANLIWSTAEYNKIRDKGIKIRQQVLYV